MSAYLSQNRSPGTNAPLIDLRSDTVTQPDEGMRRAMYEAELGDDVYGDDPCVNRLESVAAERLGKEASLFVPSGTMSNLAAMLAHCGRGEEVIVGRDYHISSYEAAGASVLGGIALCPVAVDADGGLSPEIITSEVKPDDSHKPISRLLSLENTHNGMAIPLPRIAEAVEAGRSAGLSVHLDGARFFNAVTELACAPGDLAGPFDSVSICLSKGLGTPAGSLLCGPADIINRARRYRKMLGGGMRQSGVLAAAGLYAMENNIARLSDDHCRASTLAETLIEVEAGEVAQATNMIFLTPRGGANDALRTHLARSGIILGGGSSGPLRIVLHKNIDDDALRMIDTEIRGFFE